MADIKVEMENTVEIEEVECLTAELKSKSMEKELRSLPIKGEQTELNSHGDQELSAELNTRNGDENPLRTLIKKEPLNTQNTLEEPSEELNSQKVFEDPLRTLMKQNWKSCDETTIVEILQEVQRCMGEKEIKTEPLEVNSSNAVDEPLKTLIKLDWKHCDANTISEILKRIRNILKDKWVIEEPSEFITQSEDNERSCVQKHLASDLKKVSLQKEVELCSDKQDSNTVVQPNNVRSGEVGNEQGKSDVKALTARLRNIRKQTQQKSFDCEINGMVSVVTDQRSKILISEEIINQEKKEDAVSQPTSLKSNVDKTRESSVCDIKVREPVRVIRNNVVISQVIENQERREDVILLPTPLPIVEKKVPSSVCSKLLERDFPKHVPISRGDFLCDVCLACFSNKGSLTKHMQVHSKDHKDDDDDDPDVKVDKVVISHKGKTEGEVQLVPTTIKTVSRVVAHECPVCLKNFRRKYDLRRHLLTHSGTNFQCVLCSTCYKNKEELSEHVRSHSLDVEVQSSEIQTENVIRSDKNEVEMSLLPKPTKTDSESISFECPFCKKNIRRKYDFRRHLFRHSGLDFQCVLCQAFCESKEDLLDHLREHSVDNLIKKTNIQSTEISVKCESEKMDTMLEFKAIRTNSNPNVQSDNVVMLDKPENEEFQTIFQTKTEVQTYDQKRSIKEYLQTQVKYVASNPVALADKIISKNQKTEKEEIIPAKINYGIKTDENKIKRKTHENSLVSNVAHSYKVARFENIETVPSKQISLNIGESIHVNKESISKCKQISSEANRAIHLDAQSDNVFEFYDHKHEEEKGASLPKNTREPEVNLTKTIRKYSKENQPYNSSEKTVTDNKIDESSTSQLNTNELKKTELKLRSFMKKSKSHRNLSVQSNSMLECDVCFTRFKHKSSLNLHKRKHDTGNPYLCKICKKSFSEDRQLVIHFRTHSIAKAFQCDFCKKRFSQYSYLHVHMRAHSGEKSYVSETCRLSFAVRGNLVMHMRIHSKEKPFQCEICGKSFALGGDFIRHSRIHLDEKPFKCETCKKRFAQKTDLERHTHTYPKKKTFECWYFGTSGNLRTHM